MEAKVELHQGSIKVIFRKDRKNLYHNTNIRVPASALNAHGFVKSSYENAAKLNEQIKLAKQKVDNAILQDLRENGIVDTDRVKMYLLADENIIVHSKTAAKFSTAIADFISNQAKMNRQKEWRCKRLQEIILANDRLCVQVKTPYLIEILDQFKADVNGNTAERRFTDFKKFVTWSSENGYPMPKVEWKKLQVSGFKASKIYLTDELLEQLYFYQPQSETETVTRNIFLILCYTGLRYSDFYTLTVDDINEGYIEKVSQKTKTLCRIPIHPRIKDLIATTPKLQGQNFNENIKNLGKAIGEYHESLGEKNLWNIQVRVRTDVSTFESKPLYEKLTSHVGRHTFATRGLMKNVPYNLLMEACGWSNIDMLMEYAKIINLEKTNWVERL